MPKDNKPAFTGAPPSPDGGWASEIVTLKRATIVPPVESDRIQACGVLDSHGEFCAHSATWRGHKPMMTPPDETADAPNKLSGRHMFAGQIWTHFGHFIAESTSRLWALEHIKGKLDSIIFIPKRPGRTVDIRGYQREFFDLLGIDIPIQVVTEPTEVEELIVPGQGFGLGEIAAGTPEFRHYFKENFARQIAPAAPNHLYLSRSELGGLEGGIVLEKRLEENLVRQGYDVFHPQQHSLAEQIARYRGAKKLIGLDGSAFHMFAFAGQPEQQVAVILRRNSNVFKSLHRHIEKFAGIQPTVLDVVQADWIPAHKSRPGRYSFGQLDFLALGQGLKDTGFIDDFDAWEEPKFRESVQEMKQFSKDKGVEFNRVKKSK